MKYLSALAAAFIALTGPASALEYLTNGDFETGDFSGWGVQAPTNTTVVAPTAAGYGAESGKFYVWTDGPPTSESGLLLQGFADTAGALLTVSGWAIGNTFDPPGTLGQVSYFLNNTKLGSPDLSSGNWVQSTFQVTATGFDIFEVRFGNDESFNGLDNFSVSSGGLSSTRDVPEPSTWAMMLIGLMGLSLSATPARGSLSTRIGSLMGRRA
jgi:PEP-CTERM motif